MQPPSFLSGAIVALLTLGATTVSAAPSQPVPNQPAPKQPAPPAPGPPQELHFPVREVILQYARSGDEYKANIGGLVLGAGNNPVTFKKTEGDPWINIDKQGYISGKPGPEGEDVSYAWVEAKSGASSANLHVGIPVRRNPEHPLVKTVNVMTYNLWEGGYHVDNFHEKQLAFILESRADVIGLQEASGNNATRLANALGWHYTKQQPAQRDISIISRYPIAQEYDPAPKGIGARVSFGKGSEINVWSLHLSADNYGPYDFCFGSKNPENVKKLEETRAGELQEVLTSMKPQLGQKDRVPVLLLGDFNSPSHKDWTQKTAKEHCNVAGFDWPVSKMTQRSGLVDSFREVNPGEPGATWSPIEKVSPFQGAKGALEPQDRIDFIYHSGKGLRPTESTVLPDFPTEPKPNHIGNRWTSDHSAVMTTFTLM